YVRETGVDVLVVTRQDLRAFGSYRGAGSWVQDRPDVFQPVAEDPAWLVVRVHPDRPAVARPAPPAGRPVEASPGWPPAGGSSCGWTGYRTVRLLPPMHRKEVRKPGRNSLDSQKTRSYDGGQLYTTWAEDLPRRENPPRVGVR